MTQGPSPSLSWGFEATAPDNEDQLSIDIIRKAGGETHLIIHELTGRGGSCIEWDLTPKEFWHLVKVFQQAWEQHYETAD